MSLHDLISLISEYETCDEDFFVFLSDDRNGVWEHENVRLLLKSSNVGVWDDNLGLFSKNGLVVKVGVKANPLVCDIEPSLNQDFEGHCTRVSFHTFLALHKPHKLFLQEL